MAQSVNEPGDGSGDAGTLLPIDAIDEFKTEENPRADMAGSPERSVKRWRKSGTNTFTEPHLLLVVQRHSILTTHST